MGSYHKFISPFLKKSIVIVYLISHEVQQGNLKTALSGIYHAFDSPKYAHRYLAEIQYRFNRRFDLSVILHRLLRASAATSPHPERLIRAAVLCG